MSNKTTEDFGRRDLDFNTPKVVDVLPEYFQSDNPKLIELLNAYMDYMDSDGGFRSDLRDLYKVRDIGSVPIDLLNSILEETGLGLTVDQLDDPRVIAQNFPDYFRYKGSLYSSKYFFRMLYGEEAEISYPKDQLFIVGESRIGPESLKLIQNGALYQVLSILIKSSQPISVWRELYKQFVHPAGFYLGGEVLAEGIVDLSASLNVMPDAIPDSDAGSIIVPSETTVEITAFADPLTILFDSDGETLRVNLAKSVDFYDSIYTPETFDSVYPSVFAIDNVNAITWDDSSTITWDNTVETFDQAWHDSAGAV